MEIEATYKDISRDSTLKWLLTGLCFNDAK